MNRPRLSHSHSRIGTKPQLRTPERSSQQACRLPGAVAVDHDLDGTILRHRLQLDRSLQCGRHAAIVVENPHLLGERGYRSAVQKSLARNELIVDSSVQFGKVPIHTGQRVRPSLFSVNGCLPRGCCGPPTLGFPGISGFVRVVPQKPIRPLESGECATTRQARSPTLHSSRTTLGRIVSLAPSR